MVAHIFRGVIWGSFNPFSDSAVRVSAYDPIAVGLKGIFVLLGVGNTGRWYSGGISSKKVLGISILT